MESDVECISYGIATTQSNFRNKEHHTGESKPGEYVRLDREHPITMTGLTPATTHSFYLIIIDAYSRFIHIYSLANKAMAGVI
jgi:hypothetical protein